jgi:DNA-binding beta-propeller fold protein YncE
MFSSPTYAVVDVKNHFFYIADSGNSRIVQYNLASGAFIGALGAVSATTGTCPSRGAATTWCSGGTFIKGMADMMFNLPSGLAVDSSTGYLYIADPNNGRINVVRP